MSIRSFDVLPVHLGAPRYIYKDSVKCILGIGWERKSLKANMLRLSGKGISRFDSGRTLPENYGRLQDGLQVSWHA